MTILANPFLTFGEAAHPLCAYLGCAPLIFDREALRASARLMCRSTLVMVCSSMTLSIPLTKHTTRAPAINQFSPFEAR